MPEASGSGHQQRFHRFGPLQAAALGPFGAREWVAGGLATLSL
jgi:hypothetical protein